MHVFDVSSRGSNSRSYSRSNSVNLEQADPKDAVRTAAVDVQKCSHSGSLLLAVSHDGICLDHVIDMDFNISYKIASGIINLFDKLTAIVKHYHEG